MRLPAVLLAVAAFALVASAQDIAPSPKPSAGATQARPTTFDRGIYLPPASDSAVCAKIKSFNFTRGADPQLKSVTTCTPMNARVSQRAHGRPPEPQPELRLVQSAEKPR